MSANFDTLWEEANQPNQNSFDTLWDQVNPKKSKLEQGARLAGQFALGALESAALPYELAVAPLQSKAASRYAYSPEFSEDLEDLAVKEAQGKITDTEKKHLESLKSQFLREKGEPEVEKDLKGVDLSIRGLTEKATGLDLHPEGFAEKAINFMGLLKDPKKLIGLRSLGATKKDIIKAILPTGTEAARGLGAGAALEIAERGDFGPIGTIASMVLGDLIGHGVAKTGKFGKELITKPKETIAKSIAKFTPEQKKVIQRNIIHDFQESGIQADLGTITDNNLIKWIQARLAQSGLTGKKLEDFRTRLTGQIQEEYKVLADELGQSKFMAKHDAGVALKEGVQKIRNADLEQTRTLYKEADKWLGDKAFVDSNKLAKSIEGLEKSLKPGSIKSTEQKAVLNALDNLKKDVYSAEGRMQQANVKDLMNNKIALNDIINYEVQGGAKQLLKGIVGELDRAIISHGKKNPVFRNTYVEANKRFSEHAKTFRNKDIDQILRTEDPSKLLNRMNNVQGIRNIENILKRNPDTKKTFDSLKRAKFDEIIGNNLVDGTTKQVKLGTFSKLLDKKENRNLIKEMLDPKAFQRLEKLQKNAGKLADSAEKFYNASKSGVVAIDATAVATLMNGVASILMGNPWPLMKAGTIIGGGRGLANLLGDAKFLELVEGAMLAGQKNSTFDMIKSINSLKPYAAQFKNQSEEQEEGIPQKPKEKGILPNTPLS